MRMRHLLLSLVVLSWCVAASSAGDDSIRPSVWASIGSDSDFGIGGGVTIPAPSIHPEIFIKGGFTYYFPSGLDYDVTYDQNDYVRSETDFTYWQIHADILRKFPLSNSSILPYVGAGVGFYRSNISDKTMFVDPDLLDETIVTEYSDSAVFLDLVGGAEFGKSKTRPFVQATIQIISGTSQVVFSSGVRF